MNNILPLVKTVSEVLHNAEVTGRTTWQLDVVLPPNFRVDGTKTTVRRFVASAQMTLPAEAPDMEALAQQWAREYARESGVPEWADG
jgi:hypothetical protein